MDDEPDNAAEKQGSECERDSDTTIHDDFSVILARVMRAVCLSASDRSMFLTRRRFHAFTPTS
jgi:hypothetical protein